MMIRYFEEPDTLHIELRDMSVVESRHPDENMVGAVDEAESFCA